MTKCKRPQVLHPKPLAIIRGKIMSCFKSSCSWLRLHIITTIYVRQLFFVSFFEKNYKNPFFSHKTNDKSLYFFANLLNLCLQIANFSQKCHSKIYAYITCFYKTDILTPYFRLRVLAYQKIAPFKFCIQIAQFYICYNILWNIKTNRQVLRDNRL